jgi:LPS-assembly protein
VSANQPAQNPTVGRAYPQAALEWRYPWLRHGEDYSQVIEPIVSFIAGANGGNPPTISNEDSLAFDYNETHLFVPDRFAGLDQVDPGDRIDYGLRTAIYSNRAGGAAPLFSTLVGASYRFQNTSTFPVGSGLEDKQSDVVGRFVVSPSRYLDAVYRYRLSHIDFNGVRHEVGIYTGPPALRFGASYVKLPADLASNDTARREQIAVSAVIGLSRYWNLSAATTKAISGNLGSVAALINATYQDECIAFITQFSQSGITDRDVKPGASIVFSVVFKNLGEISAPHIATTGF